MQTLQGITGPVVGGGYGPQQVTGPGAYIPNQTDQWTEMFAMMMPVIMMIMFMAILMPMMKGVTESAK